MKRIKKETFLYNVRRKTEWYPFPTYNLYYNHKKVNLYTSYNGEINYENIDEATDRQIYNPKLTISSVQHVRQNNKSHKFYYGVDYRATDHNIISFYGFLNPYSSEQNGNVILGAENGAFPPTLNGSIHPLLS